MHLVDNGAFLIDDHSQTFVGVGVGVECAVGLTGGGVGEVTEQGHLGGQIEGFCKHAGGKTTVDADPE